MHMCYKIFTPLGYKVLLAKKQRLGPKLEGAGVGEHKKNLGPLHISATVEASNFKFGTQLGFGLFSGLAYQKTTIWTKIGGVWARGASEKNVGPPTYLCNR